MGIGKKGIGSIRKMGAEFGQNELGEKKGDPWEWKITSKWIKPC
jgi:hypothetical protein